MADGLEVEEQGNGITYGILVYDVPNGHQSLYNKLYRAIRRLAIRVNLSVYLFQWGLKEKLEQIVAEAEYETGNRAAVFVLPFDNRSVDKVRRLAASALKQQVDELVKRLYKKEAEKKEDGGVSLRYVRDGKERLKEINGLAVLYGLTKDIEVALTAALRLFEEREEQVKEQLRASRESAKQVEMEAQLTLF